ncbi:hypothetical protein SARC_11102 [Sphaeroforma arctica JP610]|uniref:Uncharacterized protein n=1 Tax=Sphaeroforma arctica JP610 TaxID=667725 RepID=A0A0L0FIU6_9EUKA|nr:hypothetical protein SARC_11102 [Sphaeroforma arctica JP610]KNC76396.1 hypothetical protein SARC_11102 [Sphaeroforma arctica JP610]|eukprot:XP_014150298.1 hypothetical protein SARC_11102 [Sphaeroforma arctica JP610]
MSAEEAGIETTAVSADRALAFSTQPWRAAKEALGESLRQAEARLGGAATGPSGGSLGAMAATWLGKTDRSTSGGSLGTMYTRSMSAVSSVDAE